MSTINVLKPVNPKLSNKNKCFVGWTSKKLHQCVPALLFLSALKIANGYFVFLSLITSWKFIYLASYLMSKHPWIFFKIFIFFITKNLFCININNTITSHSPYLDAKLLTKFLVASDPKIFLTILLFILLTVIIYLWHIAQSFFCKFSYDWIFSDFF